MLPCVIPYPPINICCDSLLIMFQPHNVVNVSCRCSVQIRIKRFVFYLFCIVNSIACRGLSMVALVFVLYDVSVIVCFVFRSNDMHCFVPLVHYALSCVIDLLIMYYLAVVICHARPLIPHCCLQSFILVCPSCVTIYLPFIHHARCFPCFSRAFRIHDLRSLMYHALWLHPHVLSVAGHCYRLVVAISDSPGIRV